MRWNNMAHIAVSLVCSIFFCVFLIVHFYFLVWFCFIYFYQKTKTTKLKKLTKLEKRNNNKKKKFGSQQQNDCRYSIHHQKVATGLLLKESQRCLKILFYLTAMTTTIQWLCYFIMFSFGCNPKTQTMRIILVLLGNVVPLM